MGVYEDYDKDYHAGDRDEVLSGIKKYGTDDRSKWVDAPAAAPPGQPANQGGFANPGQAPQAPTMGGMQPPAQGGRLGDDESYNGMSRDDFRNQVTAGKWANQADMDQWMAAHGATKAGGNGTFTDQWGRTLDMGIGYKSGGPIQGAWTAQGGGPGGGGPGGNPGTGGPSPGWGAGPPGGMPGISEALYNQLMKRATQSEIIDPNDPNIRQQLDPMAAAQERQKRNYLADIAESSGSGANLRGEERLANERAGQNTGMLKSQLIGRELESKRAQIESALQGISGRITEDQRIALQKELGYLNDATQRYGIDQQTGLGYGQLDLGRGQLGRDIGRDEMDFWLRSQGM